MNRSLPPPEEPAVVLEPTPSLVDSPSAGPAALRGGALRSGSYVVTVLLSVAWAPLLIRHLGIAAFGRYTSVVAIVTIVGGLTDAGLLNIALREWATRAGLERRAAMRSLLGVRVELSAAGVLVGVGFAALAGYSSILVVGTLVAGIGMMLQATANLLTAPLQGELRFGWASIIDVTRQVAVLVLVVVLVVLGAGLLPLLAVTIPAGVLTLGFAAMLVRRDIPLLPTLRGTGRAWPLLRDTLPYAAAIALNTIYFRVTIVAMSLIASAEQTGYFATSFRVTEVLVGVPALAIGAAFPILSRAAREHSDRFAYATERILELALIAGTALSLVVVLSAPFVIDVLAGRDGAPATSVLQIQGTALIATFLAIAAGFPLLALRRHAALLMANGGALVANIVLTLVLVPIDQAKGAAIAAVAAESCLALGQLVFLLRLGRARVRLTAPLIVTLVGLAGASPLLVPGLHPLLRTVAGVAIYGIGLALLGLWPPELRQVLERTGGRRR